MIFFGKQGKSLREVMQEQAQLEKPVDLSPDLLAAIRNIKSIVVDTITQDPTGVEPELEKVGTPCRNGNFDKAYCAASADLLHPYYSLRI